MDAEVGEAFRHRYHSPPCTCPNSQALSLHTQNHAHIGMLQLMPAMAAMTGTDGTHIALITGLRPLALLLLISP